MSIEAVAWALKQDLARSSEKFVLVCLANYADEMGVCYPSVPQLCDDTSQDRKTVISSIDALIAAGLLADTGNRVGATRQIPVYQILGLPTTQSRHYVFRVTDPATGRFYVGKRSCIGEPQLDALYKGCGKWTRAAAAGGVELAKEVLAEFGSCVEALAAEQRLLREHQHDPLCMNDGGAKTGGRASQKRNSSENGTVPNFPSNSPVFPAKQSRFSAETVPKTGHGTIKEPSRNRHGTTKGGAEPLPDWVPPQAWHGFIASRKAAKGGLTERAEKLLLAKLDDLRKQGYPPDAVLDQSTMHGWKGLFPIRNDRERERPRHERFDPTQFLADRLARGMGGATSRPADGDVWDAVPEPIRIGSGGHGVG